jgi:hypothetical protein
MIKLHLTQALIIWMCSKLVLDSVDTLGSKRHICNHYCLACENSHKLIDSKQFLTSYTPSPIKYRAFSWKRCALHLINSKHPNSSQKKTNPQSKNQTLSTSSTANKGAYSIKHSELTHGLYPKQSQAIGSTTHKTKQWTTRTYKFKRKTWVNENSIEEKTPTSGRRLLKYTAFTLKSHGYFPPKS